MTKKKEKRTVVPAIHICHRAEPDCYNICESYGEICVHCGCCAKETGKRHQSRLALHRRLKKEAQDKLRRWLQALKEGPEAMDKANLFDPDLQIKNCRKDIKWNDKKIKYYKTLIKRRKERRAKARANNKGGKK